MPVKVTLFLALVAAVVIGMLLPTPHTPKTHTGTSQFAALEDGTR